VTGVRVSWDLYPLGRVHCDKPGLAEAAPVVEALHALGFEPELSETPGARARGRGTVRP
jgi:hypothetical protein